jgi:hypothetical protein
MQREYTPHKEAYSIDPFSRCLMTDLEVRDPRRQRALEQALSERKKPMIQKEKRRKLCITLPQNQYLWLVSRVNGGTYYNISQALEMCIKETRRHQTRKEGE